MLVKAVINILQENIENIYDELNSLINNKHLLQSHKESAYKWVKKNHDIKNVATSLYNYYKLI